MRITRTRTTTITTARAPKPTINAMCSSNPAHMTIISELCDHFCFVLLLHMLRLYVVLLRQTVLWTDQRCITYRSVTARTLVKNDWSWNRTGRPTIWGYGLYATSRLTWQRVNDVHLAWLGGVLVRASELWSKGYQFDSRPFHCRIA